MIDKLDDGGEAMSRFRKASAVSVVSVVKESCPVCGQGRVLVAVEKDGHSLFVVCEDCESEWSTPIESCDASLATRDQHTFLRYLAPADLIGHQWHSQLLNA